jgi:hypothetical protein
MDWQEATALVIVAVTAAIFVWRRLRPRKFDLRRDSPCGCSSHSHSGERPPTVVFHARKGERPQFTVRHPSNDNPGG